jgi:hypothetical protein
VRSLVRRFRKRAEKANRNSDVVDVPADNPVGTMDRFTEGLRREPAAPKPPRCATRKRKRR